LNSDIEAETYVAVRRLGGQDYAPATAIKADETAMSAKPSDVARLRRW